VIRWSWRRSSHVSSHISQFIHTPIDLYPEGTQATNDGVDRRERVDQSAIKSLLRKQGPPMIRIMPPLEDRRGRVINYAQEIEPCTVKRCQSAQSHEDQEEQNGIRKAPP